MSADDRLYVRYTEQVGREIRHLRRELGLSQASAAASLARPVQPLEWWTWENGLRDMPLSRLVDASRTMNTLPHLILAAADRAVLATPIVIDLAALSTTRQAELGLARRWAATLLSEGNGPTMPISREALARLAELTEMDPASLEARLRELEPNDEESS